MMISAEMTASFEPGSAVVFGDLSVGGWDVNQFKEVSVGCWLGKYV